MRQSGKPNPTPCRGADVTLLHQSMMRAGRTVRQCTATNDSVGKSSGGLQAACEQHLSFPPPFGAHFAKLGRENNPFSWETFALFAGFDERLSRVNSNLRLFPRPVHFCD
jgi:hypothetical protein